MSGTPVPVQGLKNDLSGFMEMIRPNVKKTVWYFVSRGFFRYDEADDVEQELYLHMIEHAEGIFNKFEGRSKLQTYLVSILINRCRNLATMRKHTASLDIEEIPEPVQHATQYTRKVFEGEYRRLSSFLELFHRKKFKLILCLKMIYRIVLKPEDFLNCFPGIAESDYAEMVNMPATERAKLKDKELYATLTPLLNKYEQKDNSPDAVRRWVDMKVDELVSSMNGYSGQTSYTPETFQILFELYCDNKR